MLHGCGRRIHPLSGSALGVAGITFVALCLAGGIGSVHSQVVDPVVRVVYLVPIDRAVRHDYSQRLRYAIRNLQIFYRNELGDDTTFSLNKPIVEVVPTPHLASWYSTNPAGPFSVWFFNNVVTEGFALTGGRFFDPSNIWVFYIDSDPACGQLVGATSGVAVLPANDLRGLAGESNIPPCPADPPDTAGVCRWIGGLGHELGHAFGLPHPPGCEDADPATSCPSNTLLWLGYITYPETFLLDDDKARLRQSPFFSSVHLGSHLPDCSRLDETP
jgi:hypothetical protein